jgi:hypothetical protein
MTQGDISTTELTTKSAVSAGQPLAQAVRDACVRAAIDGYEQGGLSGLCAEGRFDMAIDAIRSLHLGRMVGD